MLRSRDTVLGLKELRFSKGSLIHDGRCQTADPSVTAGGTIADYTCLARVKGILHVDAAIYVSCERMRLFDDLPPEFS